MKTRTFLPIHLPPILPIPALFLLITFALVPAPATSGPSDDKLAPADRQGRLPADPAVKRTFRMVPPGASLEAILARAARVKPHPRQAAWQAKEFTAFIHFGMNTFTDREWGEGKEKPEQFAPTAFDADQWAAAFRSAGMTGVVLTAKHHDGFCLWPTKTTEHCVRNSPWMDGEGDVVGAVEKACRAAGLDFGIYLSPWDRNAETFGTPEYNRLFRAQLEELLTHYGPLYDVWFDGAHAPKDRPDIFDWKGHYRLIRELQPGACISVMGPDVRWCGNEAGSTRAAEWNVIPLDTDDPGRPEEADPVWNAYTRFNPMAAAPGSEAMLAKAKRLVWWPAMTNTSIRPGWFYHASQDGKVKSLTHLLDVYYGSVGGNTQFLLNVPPDRRGLVHENDARRLAEMGKVLAATFDTNLAAGARGAECVLDGDPATGWRASEGVRDPSWTLELPGVRAFDVVRVKEMIREGQRVASFAVDARADDGWREIARAATIGYQRLIRLEKPVSASAVRFRILESRAAPRIAEVGLFLAPSILEAPGIERDLKGRVTLTAPGALSIRYAVTSPGVEDPPESLFLPYRGPFSLPDGGRVVAETVAPRGGDAKVLDLGGARRSERTFGLAKAGWRVVFADSEEPPKEAAIRAIDGDPRTHWHTAWSKGNPPCPHEIVIDLGREVTAGGFTYLPRQDGSANGTAERYALFGSVDGKVFGEALVRGRFDNIENNPVEQVVRFEAPARLRYLKFVVLESVGGRPWASAAELGVIGK